MRSRLAMAVLAMFVVGFASLAEAQPGGRRGAGGRQGGGMMGRGSGMLALLQIEAVQKELDLTEEQIGEIREILASVRGGRPGGEARREGAERRRPEGNRGEGQRGERRRRPEADENSQLQALAGTSYVVLQQPGEQTDDERRARFEELRKQFEARQQEAQAKLEKVLLPHQLKRLRQIYIQTAGVGALNDASIAKELKITDKQIEQFGKVREEAGSKMRELFQAGDRESIREKMGEMREELNKKTLAVLTAEQQKKFEEMKGEKFEMPENAGRGGFRGRRAGGEGGERGEGNRRQQPDA